MRSGNLTEKETEKGYECTHDPQQRCANYKHVTSNGNWEKRNRRETKGSMNSWSPINREDMHITCVRAMSKYTDYTDYTEYLVGRNQLDDMLNRKQKTEDRVLKNSTSQSRYRNECDEISRDASPIESIQGKRKEKEVGGKGKNKKTRDKTGSELAI